MVSQRPRSVRARAQPSGKPEHGPMPIGKALTIESEVISRPNSKVSARPGHASDGITTTFNITLRLTPKKPCKWALA